MLSRHKTMQEISALLEPHGITIVGDEVSKKHRKVWLTDGKITKFVTVSSSPSDRRTFLNLARDAKKMFREAP